jgi:hypothetical protein
MWNMDDQRGGGKGLIVGLIEHSQPMRTHERKTENEREKGERVVKCCKEQRIAKQYISETEFVYWKQYKTTNRYNRSRAGQGQPEGRERKTKIVTSADERKSLS